MKKKILGVAIVAAIALVSGWNISQSKSDVALSDVALENVEALADENGGSSSTTCRCSYSNTICSVNNYGETCASGVNVQCWSYDLNCR
jgi:hypothetical protein